ncbi:GNAT family N-acetyltransferase [Actinoplanes sp. TRM 88003]|uniref:GNAT family N-acetyltransferase n=1 Tax=Paractinoplanes aksuensis TaxID=2939490 RepID=A0ABT1DHD3_9ACTN|nr:GNAT family N-acetyltransferase [Actinoplanes aksuensis]MCO8270209.1 GNAT family N-acetyltransferase [Actinoplanes aksuensis]
MTLVDTADTAARAYLGALKLLAGSQRNGYFRQTPGGTAEIVTGAPFPSLNGIVAVGLDPSADEIAELAASPRLNEVAWTIHVRGDDVDPRIVGVAGRHGLTGSMPLPFLVRPLTEADAADVPTARRITGADSIAYQRTMAAGFEAPEPLFTIFAETAVVELPGASGYLVEVDGVPVATSFGVLVGDQVGVFNIAVPPAFRRKGYGRVATAAVLKDAYAAGARTAFLHATPDGLPLYRAMGFELAENWTVFAAGA